MLLVWRITSTAGFTCRLFAFWCTAGVRTVLSALKDHGSAAAVMLGIIESPSVMAATAAALSVVEVAVAAAVAVSGF